MSDYSMKDSLCPNPSMGPHGSMVNVMADSMMLRHMDQAHAIPGKFSWNSDNTECWFAPDSMMRPLTQHMIHMGSELMDMLARRMGNTGVMDGHTDGMMRNEMLLHFSTLDTTQAGGGHSGHH